MKQLTEYTRVSGYLVKIFRALNETYFESKLSIPVITIQSTPRAYGHVSVCEVWTSGDESRRELNIGAGTINRPIEEVVATLLHEMCHLYNLQRGVQDCSRGGAYHNKIFRDTATARDLDIQRHDVYGWTITAPTDRLIQWCIDHELEEIRVFRHDFGVSLRPPRGGTAPDGNETPTETPKTKQSTRKYICPCCGAIVRATRDLKIICGECFNPAAPDKIPYMQKQG